MELGDLFVFCDDDPSVPIPVLAPAPTPAYGSGGNLHIGHAAALVQVHSIVGRRRAPELVGVGPSNVTKAQNRV